QAAQQKVADLRSQGKDALAAGLLAQAKGRRDEAGRLFTEAAGFFDSAVGAVDAGDQKQREEIEALRKEVGEHLQEAYDRRRFQEQVRAFARESPDVMFHEIHPTGRDAASRRAAVLRLAPAALARFGLDEVGAATGGRPLLPRPEWFESPEQYRQTAEECYEVLLVWADAAVKEKDGAARALQLLGEAEALARA